MTTPPLRVGDGAADRAEERLRDRAVPPARDEQQPQQAPGPVHPPGAPRTRVSACFLPGVLAGGTPTRALVCRRIESNRSCSGFLVPFLCAAVNACSFLTGIDESFLRLGSCFEGSRSSAALVSRYLLARGRPATLFLVFCRLGPPAARVAVRRPAEHAPGDDRHAARRPPGLLRPRGRVDARSTRLAARGVRFETAVAHVPLTGPSHASILTGRARSATASGTTVAFALPAGVKDGCGGLPSGRVPHGGVRLGLSSRPALRARPRIRHVRRSPAARTRPSPHAVRRTLRGRDDRRCAAVAAAARRCGALAVVPLGALLRPARALRAAAGSRCARRRVALRRRDRVRGPRSSRACSRRVEDGGALGAHDRARDRRSRREPGGARRGHAWPLPLRCDVAGAVDHGRAGNPERPRDHGGRAADRRAADADRLRRPAVSCGCGRPLAACGRRRAARWRTRPRTPSRCTPQLEFGWAPLFAWRTARFKFIEAPTPELYDLVPDAGEAEERVAERAARARCDRSCRPRFRPDAGGRATGRRRHRPAAGALGYIGGGAVARRAGATGRDPKDGVHLMPRSTGMSAARTDPELAIRDLTAVLREEPGLLMARRTRAVAYAAAGRHEQAIAELRAPREGRAAQRRRRAWCWATTCGSPDGSRRPLACSSATRATTRSSRSRGCRWPRSTSSQERYAEAEAAVMRALELAPDHLEALRRLGDIALRRGDLEAAGARYAPHPRARSRRMRPP